MNCTYTLALLVLLLIAPLTFAQRPAQGGAVLAHGNPPLTQGMVDKNVALFEYTLEIKLTSEQRERFRQGLVRYWTENNSERIRAIVNNTVLAGQPDKLRM